MEEVFSQDAPAEFATNVGETLAANVMVQVLAANASRASFVITVDVADTKVYYGTLPAELPVYAGAQGVLVKAGAPPFRETNYKGAVCAVSSGAAALGGVEVSYQQGEDQGEQPTGTAAFVPSGPSDKEYQQAIHSTTGGDPPQPGTQ